MILCIICKKKGTNKLRREKDGISPKECVWSTQARHSQKDEKEITETEFFPSSHMTKTCERKLIS